MKNVGSRCLFLSLGALGCSGRYLDLDDFGAAGMGQGSGGTAGSAPATPEPGDNDVAPNWRCIATPREPPVTMPLPSISYFATIEDFQLPGVAIAGMDIRVCQIGDAACNQPIPAPVAAPSASGLVEIGLPFGFEGFLQIQAPGYWTTDYYFLGPSIGTPLGGTTVRGGTIRLMRNAAHDSFVRDLGYDVVPDAGMLMFTVDDCDDVPAPGVRLAIVNAAPSLGWVYFDGVLRSGEPPPLTGTSGIAGFFNVPIGAARVEVTVPCAVQGAPACDAPEVAYTAATLRVRPGTVSAAELRSNYYYGR